MLSNLNKPISNLLNKKGKKEIKKDELRDTYTLHNMIPDLAVEHQTAMTRSTNVT